MIDRRAGFARRAGDESAGGGAGMRHTGMRWLGIAVVMLALGAAPAGAQDAVNVPWERQLPPLSAATEVQPSAIPNCRDGSMRCVARVERRLRRQYRRLDAKCDHRVIAALAYLRITQALRRDLELARPRFFRHRRWMAFVITDFANAYFRAFNAHARGEPVPAAWEAFYDAAAEGETTAIQDLLLFSNAHAQHDLAFSYARMGVRTPAGVSRKSDHDGVNEINVRVIPGIKAEIEERYDPSFPDFPGPVDEMGGLEPTKLWREGAWRNAERLIDAADRRQQEEVAAQIEATSAAWARLITGMPSPPGTRQRRDAHCRAAHA